MMDLHNIPGCRLPKMTGAVPKGAGALLACHLEIWRRYYLLSGSPILDLSAASAKQSKALIGRRGPLRRDSSWHRLCTGTACD